MKYKGTTDVHFDIKKAGSIVLFEPLTEWASEWWEENVEDSQMIGGAYAVEHRYAEDIATGITAALTQRLSAEPWFFWGDTMVPEKTKDQFRIILNWLYLSFQPGRGRKPASWWEGGPEELEQKKK